MFLVHQRERKKKKDDLVLRLVITLLESTK